jgi:[acyl-carrier-protein] S-malonyltransferase
MAAILGLSAEEVEAVCRDVPEARSSSPANFNGAGQVVIAGHREASSGPAALPGSEGKGHPLAVSAPFHCRLMEPVARALAPDLEAVAFPGSDMPLFTNVDARPIATGAEAWEALTRQVASPVRWEETIEAMAAQGVKRFVEVGPGKVLSGLVRKIVRDASVASVSGPADVERFFTEGAPVV